MQISIIIPAHKSAKYLKKNVELVAREIESITKDYEILLVEGGNQDNTSNEAAALVRNNKRIKHIHSKERLGKGKALSIGFREATGEISGFTDADLDVKPAYFKSAIQKIRQGYDIAIISQHHPKSDFQAGWLREILSKAYNFLVRLILGSKIKGHQTGLKCFKRNAIKKILPYVQDEEFFWDSEVLMIGQWLGFKIVEIPIKGTYGKGDSTVKFWHPLIMFISIIKFKWRRMTELSGLKPNRP